MGQFDQVIANITNRIAAARATKQQEAKSVATTAENMFGNVGIMVGELQPHLAEKFPEQQPEVSLDCWVQTPAKDGATNTLKLKSATARKDITLEMKFGHAEVSIGGATVSSFGTIEAIAAEITRFYIEG